jgi:predicted O-linked N-acetylglucosamine transferase (SPINDLY family)
MIMAASLSACWNSASVEEGKRLLLRGDLVRAGSVAEHLTGANPRYAEAWHLLGLVAARANRLDAAIAHLQRAVELGPLGSACWRNLGSLLLAKGQAERSLGAYHRAYELENEDDPETVLGIAKALLALSRPSNAAEVLQALVETQPECAEGHRLLADAFTASGRPQLALPHREEAFRLRPWDDSARARLAAARWDHGDLAGSLELSKVLVATGRATPSQHSFYLSGLLHRNGETAGSIRKSHERWWVRHAPDVHGTADLRNEANPERRIRVGYLGGDFFDNPSLYFLLPFFQNHDPAAVEVFGYDLRCKNDPGTRQIRARCAAWRQCRDLSDQQIWDQIRADRIDVLVETTGHYAGNRVHLLAHRPAPVQIAMLNYPATTGLRHLDGVVTDLWVCPEGLESQYSEPVLRLSSGYLPYAIPENAPPVPPLPALRNGFVSFGLFQRPVKIGPAVWDAMSAVIHRTPGSRLVIHNTFQHLDCYVQEFGARGIGPDRLRFVGPADFETHLGILAEADIALDTFPYNGQTTTCECLWMGVPVITLTGEYHVARVGRSILHRSGFPQWETHSVEEYMETAVRLASDPEALAATRAAMRPQVAGSLLADGRKVTQELETHFRALWRRWCHA